MLQYKLANGGNMKYFYSKRLLNQVAKYDFITGYEIKDDKIIVNYANKARHEELKFSPSTLKLIEVQMRNQVLSSMSDAAINEYRKYIKSANWWMIYNLWFIFYSSFNAANGNYPFSRALQSILCLGFISMLGRNIKDKEDYKEYINEIEKYRFFIENEDTINYEIVKRYFESDANSPDISGAPLITINDIDDMTLTELKETVELIRKNYSDELDGDISLNLKQKST